MFFSDGQEGNTKKTWATNAWPRTTVDAIAEVVRPLLPDYFNPIGNTYNILAAMPLNMRPGKAFAKAFYQHNQIKLSAEIKAQIGQLLSSFTDEKLTLRLTLGCGGSSWEYYHEDSCWWGDYERSRDVLEHNGGGSIRAYNEEDELVGRVWFLPYEDHILLFNSYGNGALEHIYAWGVLVEQAFGWKSKKVSAYFGCDNTDLYVNSRTMMIVGPEMYEGKDSIYPNIDVDAPYYYSSPMVYCPGCDELVREEYTYYHRDVYRVGEGYFCESCHEGIVDVTAGRYTGHEALYGDVFELEYGDFATCLKEEVEYDDLGNAYLPEDGVEIEGMIYSPISLPLEQE